MRSIYLFVIAIFIVSACSDEVNPSTDCQMTATVVDMTGLDGCGFIFQTADGKRYEPIINIGWCATGLFENNNSKVVSNPMANFTLYHGQEIKFSYNPINVASICMVGETIWVTCIEEIGVSSTNL